MIAATLFLAAIMMCAGLAVLRRSIGLALLLSAGCGLWLTADNTRFEGPTLWQIGAGHGLTAMDLVGYAGAVIAVLVCVRARPARNRVWGVVACCALLAGGMVAAYNGWGTTPPIRILHPTSASAVVWLSRV